MVGPLKIGLISNPKSNANKQHGGLGARVRPEPDILVSQPSSMDELKQELQRFAHEGVELIAIDGGDGTLRDIVTVIHLSYPAQWPCIALLPAGKTNVIAAHVGSFGKGSAGWHSLLNARKDGTLTKAKTECPALEVTWPNENKRLLRGFLLGSAAFKDGVQMANDSIHPKGIAKSLAVALAIGGVFRRAMARKPHDGEDASEEGLVIVDGASVNGDRHFLFMASTIEKLTMGIRPFRNEGDGDVFWLDVSAYVKRLALGVAMAALGKYKKWMLDSGYASGKASKIDLQFNSPFVLDGDTFDPCGHVIIAASQPIRFLGK